MTAVTQLRSLQTRAIQTLLDGGFTVPEVSMVLQMNDATVRARLRRSAPRTPQNGQEPRTDVSA